MIADICFGAFGCKRYIRCSCGKVIRGAPDNEAMGRAFVRHRRRSPAQTRAEIKATVVPLIARYGAALQ